jgi:hypothetical protein
MKNDLWSEKTIDMDMMAIATMMSRKGMMEITTSGNRHGPKRPR